MHPAYSIIFFTVASGTGYGIMCALGLATAVGLSPAMVLWHGPAFAAALLVSLALVSAGLVSSAFHLGRPERALRAFTQWRTSWLSREAWFAALTYLPAIGLGIGWWRGDADGWRWWGFLLAAGAVATVYSTAMIYRSLAAVPRWSNHWVPVNYLLLAGANGALWLAFLSALFGHAAATPTLAVTANLALAFAAAAKWQYWRVVRGLPAESTLGSATGLDRLAPDARVHALDPPAHAAELAAAGDGLPGWRAATPNGCAGSSGCSHSSCRAGCASPGGSATNSGPGRRRPRPWPRGGERERRYPGRALALLRRGRAQDGPLLRK